MIDWVSFNLPYRAAQVRDAYFKQPFRAPDLQADNARPIRVLGSFDDGISVFATGSTMYISGNPVKWFTGQNVVGINCIRTLIRETYKRVLELCEIPDCIEAAAALKNWDVSLTRVDCTFAYHVGTDGDVDAWLKAMGQTCSVTHRGRGHYAPSMSCLYFGLGLKDGGQIKGSRRSVFKFYNKKREMDAHPLKCPQYYHHTLEGIADGIVRGEATYRGQELKRWGLDMVHAWKLSTTYNLHKRWIDKMQISESVRLASDIEKDLPNKLRASYLLWKAGEDMQDILPKTTFYRHIAMPVRDIQTRDEVVVPVLRVLEAEPVDESDHEELFWEIFEHGRKAA